MARIVIVTDTWTPAVNGVVTVTTKIIEGLHARGHEVVVIHPGEYLSMPLPFYPEVRMTFVGAHTLAKRLKELRPDAVHISTEGTLGWAARGACRRLGLPFTSAYHTNFALYANYYVPGFSALMLAYLRHFHRPAVRTFVPTPSARDALVHAHFGHVVVVPLGVDGARFARTAPHTVNPASPCFVYAGRIAREKNVEEFLKLDLPGTKLVIGDGPDRERLEKKYVNTTTFVGYKKGQDFVDALHRGDVLVFPSRTDTFGLVVIEALASGIPTAAHDVMGPRDIITNGKDGYLSDDLREAALACLSIPAEPCVETAKRYSWDAAIDAFVSGLVFTSHPNDR